MSSPNASTPAVADGERESKSEPEEPESAESTAPADRDEVDDRWQKFADLPPASDEQADHAEAAAATWLRRFGRRIRILTRSEWTIAAVASVLLSLLMNWRVLRDPAHAIPHDLGDPLQQAYTLSWPGHSLLTEPSGLWNTNNFFPNGNSYAFTDTLLGYLPASLIGSGTSAALLRYNLLYLASFALAFFGAYVLFRQLGARIAGSAVAAAAFAYAPWKLAQGGHLNILSVGGIVLALAMLARGHGWSLRHGYRRSRAKPGWVIAGWLVAAWQVSIGFAMGVSFAYLLAGIVIIAAIGWLVKRFPPIPWRVLVSDGIGAIAFAATGLAMAVPYYQVIAAHPEATRDLEFVDFFSPSWASFLVSPPESALWGDAHEPAREGMLWAPETTLLLGFTALAFALVGLVWSAWTRRQRWALALGAMVSVALALGTNFVDDGAWAYVLAYDYLPGFDGLRTPGRLVLYTSLVLSILIAGTLTKLADRLDYHASLGRVDKRWSLRMPIPARLALLLPMVLILAEGYSAADVPRVPDPPVAMSSVDGPVMVLPSDDSHDFATQYWSVDGFPQVVNGTAGFVPTKLEELRHDAYSFPSQKSVHALRKSGIKSIVVLRDQLDNTPWQHLLDVPRADDSVTVTDHGEVVVFAL